jgi:hypothetical protein
LIFDQIMTGYYTEMKDPKNADKTMQELKDMVFKNLQKDPIFYTKEGQFGVKGLGYSVDHPGLGEPKEPKGKYKASGYGDLNEGVMYGDSDGDFDEQEDNKERANWYYDAYLGEKDPKKKDEYLKIAREYGSYLGWGEEELPVNEEESKLRKVIREMIDAELEEAYQLVNINPLKSDKERNERDPQQFLTTYIKPSVVDSLTKNQHLRILRNPSNPENVTLAIRATLAPISSKNLGKTTDNLDKLGIDIPTDFKSFLTDTNNLGGEKKLPTRIGEMTTYKILNNATLNKDGSLVIKVSNPKYNKPMESLKESVKILDRQADLDQAYFNLDVDGTEMGFSYWDYDEKFDEATYEEVMEMIEKQLINVDKYGSPVDPQLTPEQKEEISQVVLKDLQTNPGWKSNPKYNKPMESLKESVEKELAAINKEAEHEIIASKLEKVQTLIDKKQTQISRLDEDEDLKDLTDAKKVKEISKDIKSLEKAKAKLEKMMHKGKAKSPRKEVIDETDETIDKINAQPTGEYLAAKKDAENRYDEGEEIDSIMSNYTNLSDEDQERLYQDLEGKMNGMEN